MIDNKSLLERVDLLTLIGGDLKHVANTGGGEYASPCPFCGGRDRFRVQPNQKPHGIWLCRNCTDGKWKDGFDFIMKWDNCDFRTAKQKVIQYVGGANFTYTQKQHQPKQVEYQAYTPPDSTWQAQAQEIMDTCTANLWGDIGDKALSYLVGKRGLKYETVKQFRLGFSLGKDIAGLYVPYGITIPCITGGNIWYMKIRTNKPKQEDRYLLVKGSRPVAIFNGDMLSLAPALFCEGEFDCMTAIQEIGDVISPVTLGAAKYKPDIGTWGARLALPEIFLVCYDNDESGQEGELHLFDIFGERAKLAPLPMGVKDINEFYTSGGDLWGWVKSYLQFYDPMPDTVLEAAISLGGIIKPIEEG